MTWLVGNSIFYEYTRCLCECHEVERALSVLNALAVEMAKGK